LVPITVTFEKFKEIDVHKPDVCTVYLMEMDWGLNYNYWTYDCDFSSKFVSQSYISI